MASKQPRWLWWLFGAYSNIEFKIAAGQLVSICFFLLSVPILDKWFWGTVSQPMVTYFLASTLGKGSVRSSQRCFLKKKAVNPVERRVLGMTYYGIRQTSRGSRVKGRQPRWGSGIRIPKKKKLHPTHGMVKRVESWTMNPFMREHWGRQLWSLGLRGEFNISCSQPSWQTSSRGYSNVISCLYDRIGSRAWMPQQPGCRFISSLINDKQFVSLPQ